MDLDKFAVAVLVHRGSSLDVSQLSGCSMFAMLSRLAGLLGSTMKIYMNQENNFLLELSETA